MKYVLDYVLLGFRFQNGRIILICAKYSRSYPSFGFLHIEEPYSFSEEEFEAFSGITYEEFEEHFEYLYFLRTVQVASRKLNFGEHICLNCEQFICSHCKSVKFENEMISYRRVDHSGICRECSRRFAIKK